MREIRLGWILVAAVLAEIVGIVVLMGIRTVYGYGPVEIVPLPPVGETAFLLELASVMAVAGWFVGAKKTSRRRMLHGLLVGVTAVVLYEVLTFRAPIPITWSYIAAHVVKISGGGFGGWLAARRVNESAPFATSVR